MDFVGFVAKINVGPGDGQQTPTREQAVGVGIADQERQFIVFTHKVHFIGTRQAHTNIDLAVFIGAIRVFRALPHIGEARYADASTEKQQIEEAGTHDRCR